MLNGQSVHAKQTQRRGMRSYIRADHRPGGRAGLQRNLPSVSELFAAYSILSLSIMVRSDFNFRKIFFYPFEGTKGEESEP
jgi:hypothetical protein